MLYYVLSPNNAIRGPFTAVRMKEMHEAGQVSGETPAAAAGDSDWQRFQDLVPVIEYEAAHPVPPPPATDIEDQIHAAKASGPPTPQMLVKLLDEDEAFPHPRPRKPRQHPQSPILLNPRLQQHVAVRWR
jgi:hypothetical protein